MNKLLTAFLAASILFLAGVGESSAAGGDTDPAKATSKAPLAATQKPQTLLFFMNPYGKPCQTQDAILKSMTEQLASYNAQVKYVMTTDMASARPVFMKYGVRALPMIIVLEMNGAVKKRFPPGIQNQFALAGALE